MVRALLAVFFILALLVVIWFLLEGRDEDRFSAELERAARVSDDEVNKVVKRYVPIGMPLSGAVEFLQEKGFVVYLTSPDDWGSLRGDGKYRYLAYRDVNRGVVFLVTFNVILVSDGNVVQDVYGRVHLKGI